MKLSELIKQGATDENIERLLYRGLDYNGESADLIMVLGSRKACEYRVPEAVRLYKEGKAPRILVSGGQVQETPRGEMPEWESMEQAALEAGVPRECILTEKSSMNTADNFMCSDRLLREYFPDGSRIILVTTAYHIRRALMMGRKLLPRYEFFPCPVQKGSATKENWCKTEKGRRTVLDEWIKFGYYIRVGIFEDIDI